MAKTSLIISSSAQTADVLAAAFCAVFDADRANCHVFEDAQKALSATCDIAIVNSPLDDAAVTFQDALALKKGACQVVFLTPAKDFAPAWDAFRDSGVFVLQKPLGKNELQNALRAAGAAHTAVFAAMTEAAKYRKKYEEIRLLDRAKLLLMQYLRVPEADAHKYIEKHAMDMRLSKRAVAENIIKTYEG